MQLFVLIIIISHFASFILAVEKLFWIFLFLKFVFLKIKCNNFLRSDEI